MKVHIIGGGPAGLYFAILMKKAWPATRISVFERNRPDDTFGFGARSAAAAAGWDGDRFAVLENDGSLLLLVLSTWDSPAEALAFAAAYTELLGEKYRDRDQPWKVDVRGNDVLIVEGGERERTSDYLEVLGRSSRGE